jgi:hypothetical protein
MPARKYSDAGAIAPVFTVSRVDAVTQDVAWIPGANDQAISSSSGFTGVIWTTEDGVQPEIPLPPDSVRGLAGVASIVFDASGLIEVM